MQLYTIYVKFINHCANLVKFGKKMTKEDVIKELKDFNAIIQTRITRLQEDTDIVDISTMEHDALNKSIEESQKLIIKIKNIYSELR